jgi:MoaA/NifB/PqqE/SkfB family radical SAM enzyme
VKDAVLAGMRAGRPATGPLHVHVDVTNTCNAACVTCWDHSPLLAEPRPATWKRRRLPKERFFGLLEELDALGSVRAMVVSGMGEPLTHPDIYEMLGAVKARGWHLTLMTNLVAADLPRLLAVAPDQVLVGVQGVSPASYTAFHPGWDEGHFFRMCGALRALARAGVRTRHVQVIDRNTALEVPEMARFGRIFRADRVNYKLASLADGTEATVITPEQREWLVGEGIPAARDIAAREGVATNLDLFERQVRAGGLETVPIAEVGCHIGYVYTRITVDEEVLYCCNTTVRVGSLHDGPFESLWYGPKWQALRDTLRAGHYFRGCERCGKFEQNVKWAERLAEAP